MVARYLFLETTPRNYRPSLCEICVAHRMTKKERMRQMKQLRINFIDLFLIFAFSLFLKYQDILAVDTWNYYANFKEHLRGASEIWVQR